MKELFGQRLREQRLKHHLTLEQVAEKADLSANYVKQHTPFFGVLHIGEPLNKITFAASLQDRSNLCILRAGRT